jgi:hypothetical protein
MTGGGSIPSPACPHRFRPTVPAPLFLTARVAHTHIDSQQNTYAGLSFDFSQDPEHKGFVVAQIARYVGSVGTRKAA